MADSVLHKHLRTKIAKELSLPESGVERTLALLEEGATIPFLARYRKEATGGLDEVQLAAIRDRAEALRELEKRRHAILESIDSQGKLTDALRAQILAAQRRTELEDLYLPYKPRRRTRATAARERGLEPLADLIWAQESSLSVSLEALLAGLVSVERDVPDAAAAWQGARDICAEWIAEQPPLRAALRELARTEGTLRSKKATRRKKDAAKGKDGDNDAEKFRDYFEFEERVTTIPSHRVLAVRRGENEGFLTAGVTFDRDKALRLVKGRIVRNRGAALYDHLAQAAEDALDRLLVPAIANDVRKQLNERAETEAIRVFADNLRHVLMASPLGMRPVLALDPGFRTGCKVVVLDAVGTLLADTVVYPNPPRNDTQGTRRTLATLAHRHKCVAVAVGNGTAGRETMALVQAMRRDGELPDGCVVVSVNESGASIYSASAIAREELPDKDVTVRGAVSIGRRLQDPLAELVKLDPKSIGVGQYQHDVDQKALQRSLDDVVATSVNQVGVDVNTASMRLLAYVAGIGGTLARNIVDHRAANGPFVSRAALKKVPRLGSRAFEQAAGFLRVRDGRNPIDASAVHPESYDVVRRMATDLQVDARKLVGNVDLVKRIDVSRYVDETRGEPTIRDILAELRKPGRDPRATFEAVAFREDVNELEDLEAGMILAGVVTNVTGFGAFVDIGVHQDGLVHISQLADRFVQDPAEVVKVGDNVKVKVLEVDLQRKRIGLSMKQTSPDMNASARGSRPAATGSGDHSRPSGDRPVQRPKPQPVADDNPFAALKKLKLS